MKYQMQYNTNILPILKYPSVTDIHLFLNKSHSYHLSHLTKSKLIWFENFWKAFAWIHPHTLFFFDK